MRPILVVRERRYGCATLIGDLFMIALTWALLGFPFWLIWMVIRYFR